MKRIFDIVFSFFGLLFLSPFFVIVSLLIILDSRACAFYGQRRVGKGNIDFLLLKFRTMEVGSDKKGLLTIGLLDQRVTKIGRILRKYKIDELPQLINILKGDMSFVGPRPEVRKYVDLYTPEQLKVLEVKPGLTDYASIEYMDESDLLAQSENPEKTYIEVVMSDKIKLNFKYIHEQNFKTDIIILFKTLLKIINRK
ncbi:MAG: sugar transferase [Bacteroidales bacterium]|nr:sugar transferase [Bacteroidales bacterium]MDY0216586.1 sugar transferase [Bacteroidales bacterium]